MDTTPMRTASNALFGWPMSVFNVVVIVGVGAGDRHGRLGLHHLLDVLEYLAVGTAAALFRLQGGVLAGIANQGTQLLQIGTWIGVDPAIQGVLVVLSQQFGTPTLG